jgi:hypothetical protein
MLHMKNIIKIIYYVLVALIKLLRPGGRKAIIAENVALRQQLILLGKNRERAPNMSVSSRLIFGFLTPFINPHRLQKVAIIVSPATLLKFHQALFKKKYSLLFSNKTKRKPGLIYLSHFKMRNFHVDKFPLLHFLSITRTRVIAQSRKQSKNNFSLCKSKEKL